MSQKLQESLRAAVAKVKASQVKAPTPEVIIIESDPEVVVIDSESEQEDSQVIEPQVAQSADPEVLSISSGEEDTVRWEYFRSVPSPAYEEFNFSYESLPALLSPLGSDTEEGFTPSSPSSSSSLDVSSSDSSVLWDSEYSNASDLAAEIERRIEAGEEAQDSFLLVE